MTDKEMNTPSIWSSKNFGMISKVNITIIYMLEIMRYILPLASPEPALIGINIIINIIEIVPSIQGIIYKLINILK